MADLERLSQAESDNLKLRRVPVDLLELSRAAGSFFEAQRAKKKISLEITGSACVVRADPDRISQVLHNLLSNAVKYTPEHGRIRIMAEPGKHGAVLTVEDSGIGIPPQELPLIFERFYRTDRSRSRNTGGAGIGLAIARSIAAAHGGTLTAESEPDKGSRFILTLPG
ncbi:Sensor kinase CusS [bioreactor metagenome]|uniref:histidine kinase n=1 Tax=bioreactor metagenome TaxID=1076179 RepID=A0A645FZ54_9ZZZZ